MNNNQPADVWPLDRYGIISDGTATRYRLITHKPNHRSSAEDTHVSKVAHFYDQTNDLWLEHMGGTLQAGIFAPGDPSDGVRRHNEFIARRAGITPTSRVLDAGCGFCGPAMDGARLFPGSRFEGVTISLRQAGVASERVAQAGLDEAVRVLVADYHDLPFRDGQFDVIQYLESSMHTADPRQMLKEAYRVLKPGGRLYIKDGFIEAVRNPEERANNDAMDQLFQMRTRTVPETTDVIASVGFKHVSSHHLTRMVNARYFLNAMLMQRDEPAGERTALGASIYPSDGSINRFVWPVMAEVVAYRP